VKRKKIIFVATREPSYSRVAITKQQLESSFEVESILSESKSYSLRLLSVAWQLLLACLTGKLRSADAVFIGFLAQPILPLVKILHRGVVVSDAYFSLYDAMVNDKQKVGRRSLTAKMCYWLDRFMLKHSTMCFTDTNQHVQYLRSFFQVPEADIRRLWISAESKPVSIAKYDQGTFEVFFWGGFIPLQGVDTIVRAAAMLKNVDVRFTVFGTGQTFESCTKLAKQLNANNLEFSGWQTPDNIASQAQRSHLALGIFGTTDKASRVIPNKVYEAMAMGIPLVTMRSPAADELLTEQQHCLLVDSGSPQQLADAVLWAKSNPQQLERFACQSRRLFDEVCSPAQVGLTMKSALEDVCQERKPLAATANLAGSRNKTKLKMVRPAVGPRSRQS
jgi:glycosyltransferase involved in cell wall biosynthesis